MIKKSIIVVLVLLTGELGSIKNLCGPVFQLLSASKLQQNMMIKFFHSCPTSDGGNQIHCNPMIQKVHVIYWAFLQKN